MAIVLFLLKKEKKGERWNGSCSGKKPAVTLWIYEICDDQHGFQKPSASFKKEGHQTQQQFLASHTSLLSFVEVITPQRSYGTAQEGERGDETFIQGLSNHLVDITSLILCTKYWLQMTYVMMPIVEFKIYSLGFIVLISSFERNVTSSSLNLVLKHETGF